MPIPHEVAAASEQVMLESLKKLVADLTGETRQAERFAENDYRVAAAALLVHAATIALIAAGTAAEHEAVDLYHFTSSINRSLDDDGRRRIIEMMWEIVYADGRLNEFEDNLVWRAADLLNVASRDRVEIRQRVAREQQWPNDGD